MSKSLRPNTADPVPANNSVLTENVALVYSGCYLQQPGNSASECCYTQASIGVLRLLPCCVLQVISFHPIQGFQQSETACPLSPISRRWIY
jgi:hypothetical protein